MGRLHHAILPSGRVERGGGGKGVGGGRLWGRGLEIGDASTPAPACMAVAACVPGEQLRTMA
jgi:hypothetical protein